MSNAAERVFSIPELRRRILFWRVPWTGNLAAGQGRLDVLQEFGDKLTGFMKLAMVVAAMNVHLDVVK